MYGGDAVIPYYLLRSSDFSPEKINKLSSGSQVGLERIQDDAPYSLIQKKGLQNIIDFVEYDLVTETLKKEKGRAYGKPDIFQDFILIKEDLLFFNKENKILILSTSKDNFLKFVKRFEDNTSFNFERIPINFKTIINDVLNLGTSGVWLGGLDSINLRAVGLMGNKIQDSNEYQMYIDSGAAVTNISFIYDFNGKQEKIMISSEGGVNLYKPKPINEAIDLVIDVYKKMLLK